MAVRYRLGRTLFGLLLIWEEWEAIALQHFSLKWQQVSPSQKKCSERWSTTICSRLTRRKIIRTLICSNGVVNLFARRQYQDESEAVVPKKKEHRQTAYGKDRRVQISTTWVPKEQYETGE